ncbi:LacI family DNA-binding transcriptional regulator [Mucilaginibacter sp. KACC 22063]|uniref:LacI family DNA-binding transcriptional regulator n=1 Tax=Mucilaginibacter sp. KACC 22063 TaxID=3025666 RepID=UPI002365CB6D|nr:LacI family DNA-binding transcriptional regulator [Mucilaginibacter sp. KACC 22063]WDF54420.1 LacI family DNA-binding transcriptional regulator [Mucilaginibacter sp. KACC 22063]
MTPKKISIKDIAKLTNTSITTVSFVLNGKGRTSKELSQKILEVAAENGYEPNRMAVGLRTGESKVIGLLVENIGGPFFGEVAKVIEEEAERRGYGIIYCSTNNSIQKGKDVIKMLSNQLVDGYIITPLKGLEKEVQDIVTTGRPVVLIDGYFPDLDIPHVLVDNMGSVYQGVDTLIKGGYSKIGFVTIDFDLVQLQDRLRGYKEALSDAKIKFDKKRVLTLPALKGKDEQLAAIKKFLNETGLDAIFFATNYLGIMGLQCFKELSISVPEDIAVVTFDDDEIFNLYPPGITTVQQPVQEIAKSAVDILMAQLEDRELNLEQVNLQIPSKIIERASSTPKKNG